MKLSIVLEWDNALRVDTGRPPGLVEELARQIECLLAASDGSPEIAARCRVRAPVQLVVVLDDEEADRSRVERTIHDALRPLADRITTSWATTRATYYDLKNKGVSRATGDVIVLLDSDVLPEPGWLVQLLEPFADPSVEVVGGGSYVEPVSVYTKSFALGWLFPLRSEGGALHESKRFYANNVAFRAEVIRRHPFPAIPGACRGAGRLLARDLVRAGIKLHRNPRARVVHPPPRPRDFARRGIAAGRDNLLRRRIDAGERSATLRASWNDVRRRTLRAWRRILKQRDRVQLKAREVPPALLIMGGYYGFFLAGDLLTRLAPGLAQRRFRV